MILCHKLVISCEMPNLKFVYIKRNILCNLHIVNLLHIELSVHFELLVFFCTIDAYYVLNLKTELYKTN